MDDEDEFKLAGGSIDGRYDVERRVSAGGFGTVYLGRHRALRTPVALKVLRLPPDIGDDEHQEFTRRFLEEAQMLGGLRHPAVVKALDFGVSRMPDGRTAPWMALEWVEGQTLRDVLLGRRGVPASPSETFALLRPVLEALAEAHAAGIAHRDIKPANIMVTEANPAMPTRVLDFGIAKAMTSNERAVPSGNTATASADIAFSARYAAPEQVGGGRTGPWTDVHALGLVLTEMLTGNDAYQGQEAVELAASALSPQRPTPARFGVDVGAWEPVLARALAFKAADRYADAGALLAALDEVSRTGAAPRAASTATSAAPPATARPVEPPPEAATPVEQPPATGPQTVSPAVSSSASPRALRAVLTGVVALGVVAAAMLWSSRPRGVPTTAGAAAAHPGAATGGPARRRCRAPSTLAPIAGLADVVQISAGGNHACARLRDGTLRCWGENSDGQLGDGTTDDRAAPVVVPGLSDVTQVASGTAITCALRGDGSVWCWGRGIVPNSGEIQNLRPSRIAGVHAATQVTAGLMHACALGGDGGAWCWGQNERGQLGGGVVGDLTDVTRVAGLGPAVELAAGEDHTCARLVDASVWCWGRFDHGELGDGRRGRGGSGTPVRARGVTGAAQLAVNEGFSCARVHDGTVWCWGGNRDGQLGDGTDVPRPTPTAVPGVTGAVDLIAGAAHVCARRADGTVVCWGGNAFCEMGAEAMGTLRAPENVPGVVGMSAQAAGQSHACGLSSDGAVRCWGWNRFGQLGDGVATDQPDTEAY